MGMPEISIAMEIVYQLQEWIEDRDELSSCPIAHITWTANGMLEIGIGDVGGWSSEVDSEEDMTLKYCKDAWLEHISSFQPFAAEALEKHLNDNKVELLRRRR